MRRLLALLLLLLVTAAAPQTYAPRLAAGAIGGGTLPYLPGSVLPARANGFAAAFTTIVDGPADGERSVIVAGPRGLSMRSFAQAPAPDPSRPFIAVASYDDGVVLHEAHAPYRALAALGIAGAPGDVAIASDGRLATTATDGLDATIVSLAPWSVRSYTGVPFGDEVAFGPDGALFVTNRDIGGNGAITRVARDGTLTQRVLGMTAEGLAIDASRSRAYVANVNDGTVSVVDTRTLVEIRRFRAIDRVFSLALSGDGTRLFAVSNQSLDSPFASAGAVVAIDVVSAAPHVVATSPRLTFPVGIAYDAQHDRLFVTDEDTDAIDVLDARTLREVREPISTCDTPWKPNIDRGILYIPCARSNEIDAFDVATLRRIGGAPFATGGYPLSVAVWHGA
jgi:DNA-binding beta-propeller fold protein YncE